MSSPPLANSTLRKRSGAREEAVASGYSIVFVTVPELSIIAVQE